MVDGVSAGDPAVGGGSVSLDKGVWMSGARGVELIHSPGHGTPVLQVSRRPYMFTYVFPVIPIPLLHSHPAPTGSHSNRFNMYLVICMCSCILRFVVLCAYR